MLTPAWLDFVRVLRTITIIDVIDVLLVAYIIFQAIQLVRETRAEQLIKGLLAILLFYLVSYYLEFRTLKYITYMVLQNAVVALMIIFQPELRRALEQVGRSRLGGLGVFPMSQSDESVGKIRILHLIEAITDSCAFLSKQKIGALIVIERETKLGEIIKTGTVIDSEPSMELIGNIFFPNSPLHDGALVTRGGKLYAAGCFLPLSANNQISRTLGTRHRAALGMSENSDAIVVVVSEETGVISVASSGRLERNYTLEKLSTELRATLMGEESEDKTEKKQSIWKVKK